MRMKYSIRKDQEYLIHGVKGRCTIKLHDDKYYISGKINSSYNESDIVKIKLYKVDYEITAKQLFLISAYGLVFPFSLRYELNNIRFYLYTIGNVKDRMLHNIVFEHPVEYRLDSRYRHIAACPRYVIDRQGNVIDTKTQEKKPVIYKAYNNRTLYPVVNIRLSTYSRSFLIHRLVAQTWLTNNDFINRCYVDHINGNKNDFNVTNLRWVTIQENNKYMAEQGIKTDNRPCLIKNLETGVIKEFPSTTQAAEYMGRSRFTLMPKTYIFKYRKPQVIKCKSGTYQVKLASDETPWVTLEEWKHTAYTYERPVLILQKNGSSKRENQIWFDNTEAMSEFLGLDNIEPDLKKLKDLFLTKYPNDKVIIQIERISEYPYGYLAKNVDTGKILYRKKLDILAKIACVTPSSAGKSVRNGGSYSYNGWKFKIDDGRAFADNVAITNRPINYKVTDITRNEEFTFPSLRATAKYLGIDKKTVGRYVANEKILFNKYKINIDKN